MNLASLQQIWSPADAAEVAARCREHDAEFGDLPPMDSTPIPVPDDHPDIDTFDADIARICHIGGLLLDAARHGAPAQWPALSIHDDLAIEMDEAIIL